MLKIHLKDVRDIITSCKKQQSPNKQQKSYSVPEKPDPFKTQILKPTIPSRRYCMIEYKAKGGYRSRMENSQEYFI